MITRIFVIGVILFFTGSCFAAVSSDPVDPRIPYGPGFANTEEKGLGSFKVGFDADWVIEKHLKDKGTISDPKFYSQEYLFRIGYTLFDTIEPYVKIGGSRMKARWTDGSNTLKAEPDPGFTVGGGGKVRVFEFSDYKIRLSLDGQYLYANPDLGKGYVNTPDCVVTASEFKISEWQIASIISMEFVLNSDKSNPANLYSLIPYFGFAYFDSDTKVKFTYQRVDYKLDKAENEDKFLLITGLNFIAPQNASLNIEGRWVGETAASGGFTLKF